MGKIIQLKKLIIYTVYFNVSVQRYNHVSHNNDHSAHHRQHIIHHHL